MAQSLIAAIHTQFGRNFASSLGAHTFSEEDHEVDRPMFRATGISVYLENGGTLEHAQQIAAHESARTTKLYGELAADPKSRA